MGGYGLDDERKRAEVGYEEVVWGGVAGVARAGVVSHCESSRAGKKRSTERERQGKAVLGLLASNLLSPPPACPL
jgi:hypothetical protein